LLRWLSGIRRSQSLLVECRVGEEVVVYLSLVNPITSPGTLIVQLTLQIPSGWSVVSAGFSPTIGGLQSAVYEIKQRANPQSIGVSILANQVFEGVVIGYMDYYFQGNESRYHKAVSLPVTAKIEAQTNPSNNNSTRSFQSLMIDLLKVQTPLSLNGLR
jgi:hypothetical protein